MKVSSRIPVIALVLLLAACGQAGEDGAAEETTSTSTSSPTTTIVSDVTSTSEVEMNEETIVQETIRDLAARLEVSEQDIQVMEVRDVQWPDGALGCPEEGKMYTQAVVDGTQVILSAEGRIYDYHAGADGEPFPCPSDEKDGGYEFLPPPGMP
jgi:hypothetical protein